MNVFILDYDLEKSAKMHVDSHVIKIIVESAQIISTTLVFQGILQDFLMKPTHRQHPICRWSRQSDANLRFVADYGAALYEEYMYRFGKPDKFIRPREIFKFVQDNFKAGETTPFAQAMPIEYRSDDAVKSYRQYFKKEKQHLFKWTKRTKPYFLYEIS